MGKYYVRILDNLKNYAKKIDPSGENWRKNIFDDLTSNGKQIVVTDIPTRQKDRPSIGLCGDTYFCEAGEDTFRSDSIVIYRVDSADERLPENKPEKLDGEFLLISHKAQPEEELDDIGEFIKVFSSGRSDPEKYIRFPADRGNLNRQTKASPELVRALSGTDDELREMWRPTANQNRIVTDRKECLKTMKTIWRVYRLNRYLEVSPRQKGILDGIISPELTDDIMFPLINMFNVSLLNLYATDIMNNFDSLHKMIGIMGTLPLQEQVRSIIWETISKTLDPTELRKELKMAVPQIPDLDDQDLESWKTSVLQVLRDIGRQYNDELLTQLTEDAESDTNPIHYLIEWTKRLQFQDTDLETPLEDAKLKESCEFEKIVEEEEENYEGNIDERVLNIIDKKYQHGSNSQTDSENQAIEANTAHIPDKLYKKVESWIVKTHLPQFEELKELKEIVSLFSDKIENEIKNCANIETVEEIIEAIKLLDFKLKEHLSLFPDPAILKKDFEEGMNQFCRVSEMIGDKAYELIEKGVTLPDLREIGDIYTDSTIIDMLPFWLWAESENYAPDDFNEQPMDKHLLLANPVVRQRVKSCIALAKDNIQDLQSILAQFSEPQENENIEVHFAVSVKNYLNYRDLFNKIDEHHHDWVKKSIKNGCHEDDLIDLAHRTDFLKDRINKESFEGIIRKFSRASSHSEREFELDLFESAISFHESNYGSAKDIPLSMLEKWIDNNKELISIDGLNSRDEVELSIEHNWVDHPRRKIKPNYYPYKNVDGNYGFIVVPVKFSTRFRPPTLNLSLEYEIKCKLRDSWPSVWEEPSPKDLRVPQDQWRRIKESYVFSFKVQIPIRPPKEPRTKLTLRMLGIEEESGKNIVNSKTITWDDIEGDNGKHINLHWPDGIQTGYVTDHPIGPQEQVRIIETRLLSGSSFAVVSPRRFGKTTLAQYIQERAEILDLVIPPPILCTDMRDENQKTSLRRIWHTFSENLQEQLGSSVKIRDDEDLPDFDAFDHVRKAAKDRGKKGIVLIIDEAQLFFNRKTGPVYGTKLKDRLELSWSKKNSELASVYLGFIGLPSLLEKIGANFKGFLSPINIREFKESNLNTLIYKFTLNSLHTTQEAREKLSQKAGNLYILKTLLTELVTYVNDDQRNWISYDDVDEVIEGLKSRLRKGMEPTLASYLRDILNEADDINFWKPRACYPTAAALAKAISERENYNLNLTISRVNNILNRWCVTTGFDETKRLIYTKERVIEHIHKLEELGIFNRSSGFHSDILEAWICGIAQQFPIDKEDREALFAGALERIAMPEGRELIHSGAGSQGDVFRFSENQTNYVIRTIQLKSQNDRKRFHDSVQILRILKRLTTLREDGAEYIYNLRDIGIADNSSESNTEGIIGVEIYQWIEGMSLKEKIGKLNASIVIDIGHKLSAALKLIHANEILHRDICPRNIILERKSVNPVLIDFGLARNSNYEMRTIIKGECTAPESDHTIPKWTKAADIYSLGQTLRLLLQPNSENNGFLTTIINDCVSENPENRPTAEKLSNILKDLLPKLHVEEKRGMVWEEFISKARDDIQKRWFERVVEKFKPRFISVALGIHDDIFDRCAEIAQFLDFVLEAYPNEKLKFGIVRNKHTNTFKGDLTSKECIQFMSRLRIERSHYDPKQSKNTILQQFNSPTDEQIENWAKQSAELIGKGLHLKALPDLVNLFLLDMN